MRYLNLIASIFLILMSTSFAATPKCQTANTVAQGKFLILAGKQTAKASEVYFIQNKSTQSIWLDHPKGNNPGASAGWSSYLRPGHWSGLVLNKPNFALSCALIKPGKVIYVNCADALSVCNPQNLSVAKPLQGNFWLAEDKDWDAFVAALGKRKIGFQ